MMTIDGSTGEGGGQIVRTAVSMAAVTGTSIRLIKIRQGRTKPGLAPQHVRAVEAMASICQGVTVGVSPGSSEIEFRPGEVQGGSYEVDIGTAGSVTLLLQCLLPALTRADGPISVRVQGGTDVRWSPSADYLRFVALPAMEKFGVTCSFRLDRRGYYPRGGGSVLLEVQPCSLQPAELVPAKANIRGISHCSNLPSHVASRQAQAARERLMGEGFPSEIEEEVSELSSTGSGITLWTEFLGSGSLGERGLRAEEVGRKAAEDLLAELGKGAAVDIHLADQLIPYLALAGGSFTVREISSHTRTNIWTAGLFIPRKVGISRFADSGLYLVSAGA